MNIINLEARKRGAPKPRIAIDGCSYRGGTPTREEVFYAGRWRRVYALYFGGGLPSYFIRLAGKRRYVSFSGTDWWIAE